MAGDVQSIAEGTQEMTETLHPNMSLLMKLDLQNLDSCRDILSENFIWHYYNSELPELEGDHFGIDGLKDFFKKLNEKGSGGFQVNVIDARPVGDELIVTQVCNRLDMDGNATEFDAIVVWRVVDSKIAEAWDIPAVNTIRTIQSS